MPGCRAGPGRLLVTTGCYPRVVTSGEECRAVKKFGKDELGKKKKKKDLQSICHDAVSGCSGCTNGRRQRGRFVFSQFWRLKVRDHGVYGVGPANPAQASLRAFRRRRPCLPVVVPPQQSVSELLFLRGRRSHWVRVHPEDLGLISSTKPHTDPAPHSVTSRVAGG